MNTQTFAQNVKQTTRKIVRIVGVVALIAGIATFLFLYFGVYDEGVRAGTILRVSKKGTLFKTYEAQIGIESFGGLKGTSPISQTFDFSVEKDEVVKDLEAVALTGERVNLHYIKRYVTFPWRGDTKYFAVRVERLENN